MAESSLKLPPGAKLVDDASIKLPPGATLVGDEQKPVDLFTNTKKEGTYEMADKSGQIKSVPYSNVGPAFKSGYRLTPKAIKTYIKDAAADPKLKKLSPGKGVAAVGRNSSGDLILAPQKTLLGRYNDTVGALTKIDPHQPVHNLSDLGREAARGVGNIGAAGMGVVLHPADTVTGIVKTAVRATPPVALYEHMKNGTSVGQEMAQQAVEHPLETAESLIGQSAVLDAAGEVIPKVAEAAKNTTHVGRTAAEDVTQTSPRDAVTRLAEETEKHNITAKKGADDKNADLAKKHEDQTIDALDQTRQAEDLYHNKLREEQEAAHVKTEVENENERAKVNKANLEQLKKEGQERLDVLKKNRESNKNYQEDLKKTRAENDLNYHKELQRQKLEGDKLNADKSLKAKTKAAFKKARGVYNQTWNKWRDLVKNVQVDMQPAVDVINDQEKSMDPDRQTQFKEILKETKPDAEDTDGIALIRDDLVKQNGYTKPYNQLAPFEKADIDRAMADMAKSGDLDHLVAGDLKTVPASRLHGWKSQLEVAVRNTKDGIVRNSIAMVLDSLRELETKASSQVPGAEDQLLAARALTGPYFEAFFKSKEELPQEASKMLREQTPELTKEEAEQARVERIAAYDPSILSLQQHIQNLEQALSAKTFKSIPAYKDLPTKPTPIPKPKPEPLLEFTPKETPKVELPPPNRVAPPDRPPEVPPDTRTISPEDIQTKKSENLKHAAQTIRTYGLRRAMYASFTSMPAAIVTALLGHPGVAALEFGVGPAVWVGSRLLANALEKPEVVNWLTKITPKDVAAWEKLPPEQKALFTQDMKVLAEAAQKKGINISPAMAAFLAGTINNKIQSVDELKKEAGDRDPRRHVLSDSPDQTQIGNPEPKETTGPQSSAKPVWTHVYNPDTGMIEEA